jgi:hypothetical protein
MTTIIEVVAIWFGLNALIFVGLYFRPEGSGTAQTKMGISNESNIISLVNYRAGYQRIRG